MCQKQKWRNQIKMCKNTKIENEDIRKIYVEIEVDENKAIEKDLGTIEYLEQEFGWLKESGIKLNSAFIADDEEEPYAAYINYVTDWCFNHSGDDVKRKPLLSYYDWVNDYYKDLNKKYNVKLDTPWCIADYLTKNIGVAPNTRLGNRCSPFYHFHSDNKGVMLSASLEEKKLGLRSDEWHYSLYITDNNGTVGEYYTLNSLDVYELENFVMCKNRNETQEWIDENNCPITDGMSFVSYAGDCIFCGKPVFKEINNGHIIKCRECDGTFKL